MKKFVMYTARYGTPGRFRTHENSIPEVDRIYFTDLDIEEGCNQLIPIGKDRFVRNGFYQVKRMNLNRATSVPIKRQRFLKTCIPDEIFNNYEYSVYVDCKRPVFVDFEWMLSLLEPDSDFLIRTHPERDCAYDEAKWLIEKGLYDSATLLKQMRFYKREGFPRHNGLYYSAHIFRRHTKRLKEFSRLWWELVEKYSYRDQVSLPYAVWKFGMKISSLPRRRGKRRR